MIRQLICLVAFVATAIPATAQGVKLEALGAGRYSRVGKGQVMVEQGFLIAPKKGYLASSAMIYPEKSLGIPPAVISAINGKVLTFKATIDLYNFTNPGFVSLYKFSKKSYPVVGGDAYIVTLADGSGTVAPAATVRATKTRIKEGPKKASTTIIVKLDKAPVEDISILFDYGGTAKKNDDFRPANELGVIRITKGKKTGSLRIDTVNDSKKEKTERLVFALKPWAGYKLGKKKSAAVTILDDD